MIDGSVLARVLPVDPPADLATTPDWQTALTVALAAVRRGAQHPDRGQPAVAPPADERQLRPPPPREHLRRVRQRHQGAPRGDHRGHPRRATGTRHRVARVRGARQARRRAAPAPAGRAVPPAPRLAPVVRGPLARLRRGLVPAAAPAGCSRPTAATLALFDHDPFDGRAPGVRAGPPVPLRAHDPTGATRDRRLVATRSRRGCSRRRSGSPAAEHEPAPAAR